ncbi:hypothetical protein N2152v2_002477 [Parachlorella kessleri]
MLQTTLLGGGSNGIFLSPYGISQALALLVNGVANGSQSDQQLKSVVFGMDKSQPTYELNFAFAALNSQLTQAAVSSSFDVSVNNSVWLPAGYKPDPNYERAMARFYDAEVKSPGGGGSSQPPQQGGPAAATLTIHVPQSGDSKTEVKLQSGPEAAKVCGSLPGGSPAAGQPCLLLDIQYDSGALGAGKLTVVTASITVSLTQGDYSRAALLLASALVFNGLWDTRFEKVFTKPQSFHLPSGDTLTVPMMNRFTLSQKVKVAQYMASSTPCIGVQLPYQGDDYSALVVMAQGTVTAGGGSGGSSSGNSSSNAGSGAGGEQQAGCACSATGMSGGVQTGRIGCAQHLLSQGDSGYFCMVVNPSDCAIAQPTASFPGAAWVACTPGQPDGTNKDVGSSGGSSQGLVFAPTGAAYSTALAACRSQLLAGSGIAWQSQEDRAVNISLPRFQLDFTGALKIALGQLGLTQPFQGGDLTGIATAPNGQVLTGLFVSDVFHRTSAKVNEEGTQATSATTVIQASPSPRPPGARAPAPGGPPPPAPLSIVFDRPFAVVIQHNPSATALFVGEVDRPEQMADASGNGTCASSSGASPAVQHPGQCQPPTEPQTQQPASQTQQAARPLANWPKKSDIYLMRSDGYSCTREIVEACGSLSFSCPSSQQQLLVWKSRPKCVMLLKKLGNELTAEFLEVLRYLGEEQGLRVLVEPHEFAKLAHLDLPYLYTYSEADVPDLNSFVDFVTCLGGDGLILHASLLFKRAIPPIISFKLGSLGFLTCHEYKDFRRHLTDIIQGYQELDSCKLLSSLDGHPIQGVYITLRMRLLCTIYRQGTPEEEYEVLNEVVVSRGANPFLTKIEVYEHDTLITKASCEVQADGVMLATPTGSTAYNVAAGGSMVHPNVPAMMFTPICPHSLSFRPVILPDYSELEFRISEDARSPALVCLDGKVFTQLQIGDSVHVRMSPNPVPTINNLDQTTDWFNSIERCFTRPADTGAFFVTLQHWNERLEQRQLSHSSIDMPPFAYFTSDDEDHSSQSSSPRPPLASAAPARSAPSQAGQLAWNNGNNPSGSTFNSQGSPFSRAQPGLGGSWGAGDGPAGAQRPPAKAPAPAPAPAAQAQQPSGAAPSPPSATPMA